MKDLSENPIATYEQALDLIREVEAFFGQPWSYTKVVHEFAWAEVESLALRHMQVFLFREKVSHEDWWSLYRKMYDMYMRDVYRLIASNPNQPKGYPHPLLIALRDHTLTETEDNILKSVEQ